MGEPDPDPRRLILAGLLILILAAVYWSWRGRYTLANTQRFIAATDGLPYRVSRAHPGGVAAAETLAELNQRATDLVRWLRRRYDAAADAPLPPDAPPRAAATRRLRTRYEPHRLVENSPSDPTKDTSYSLDKGRLIALCLRDREAPGAPILAIDDLTFVLLHELAHLAVEAYDHPPEFWSVFAWLIGEAEAGGIPGWASRDYAHSRRRYCGLDIDYNPAKDPAVVPI